MDQHPPPQKMQTPEGNQPGIGRARGRARGVGPPNPQEETPDRPPGQAAIQETSSPESGAGGTPMEHSPEERPGTSTGVRGQAPGGGVRGFENAPGILQTRPANLVKKGVSGEARKIITNYFELLLRKSSQFMSFYTVEFDPAHEELDNARLKKALLKTREDELGVYLFDGAVLFTVHEIPEDQLVLRDVHFTRTRREGDARPEVPVNHYTVTLTFKRRVSNMEPIVFQMYNILIRKCQELLELVPMGRHFFNPKAKITIQHHQLELWPGFITSMRQQEYSPMVQIDMTMKVLRTESVFTMMRGWRTQNPQDFREVCGRNLNGVIVVTKYNNKTYKIDRINWETNPLTTFERNRPRGPISFADYYAEKYAVTIEFPTQPLLVSQPTARDIRRGDTGEVLLVPELCYQTGLTPAMRENFQLTRDLSKYLHQDPGARIQKINEFMNRLATHAPVKALMETQWGMRFRTSPVEVPGREMPREPILFRDPEPFMPNEKADWSMAFRSKQMHTAPSLARWALLVSQRDFQSIQNLISTMQRVATPLGYRIERPEIKQVRDTSGRGFVGAIGEIFDQAQGKLDMLMAVLPTNKLETYADVKVKCSVDYGIPSQCMVSRTLNNQKGLMSVCTKLVIQMNAKQGGEPWTVRNPLKGLMVIGFDVYHGGGSTVGAMTATVSDTLAQYYSTITKCHDRMEITEQMGSMVFKCLMSYRKKNQALPTRIMMYRDGVGEGQLNFVCETELKSIKMLIKRTYQDANASRPKLTYVVVTKRTNTRLFELKAQGNVVNPGPGTVVDDVITCPERYDFYLIPQTARQGTVSPISFNVLFDDSGLDADKIQRFTFKLCHMYFNWSGTVAVPAPCQYAHKLAFLTGTALHRAVNDRLSYLLHFL